MKNKFFVVRHGPAIRRGKCGVYPAHVAGPKSRFDALRLLKALSGAEEPNTVRHYRFGLPARPPAAPVAQPLRAGSAYAQAL
jgi:hypothetical protein